MNPSVKHCFAAIVAGSAGAVSFFISTMSVALLCSVIDGNAENSAGWFALGITSAVLMAPVGFALSIVALSMQSE